MLQECRFERSNQEWWGRQFDQHPDPLSRATWCHALLGIAPENVVLDCIDRLVHAVATLPAERQTALQLSTSRLGASGIARRLGAQAQQRAAELPPAASLLLLHHAAALDEFDPLAVVTEDDLAAMGAYGHAGWPALRALTKRMIDTPSQSLLYALQAHGNPAVVTLPAGQVHLPDHLAKQIIDHAGQYPMAWLLAAESCLTHATQESHLSRAAETEGWFSDEAAPA